MLLRARKGLESWGPGEEAHAQYAQSGRTAGAHGWCARPMRTLNAHNASVRGRLGGATLVPLVGEPWIASDVDTSSSRRAVNLKLSAGLLAEGRRARINLSALLERALRGELVEFNRRNWRLENARAIAAYNRHLERYGTCFEGQWDE